MSRSDRPLNTALASPGNGARRFTPSEAIALGVGLVWLLGSVGYFWLSTAPEGEPSLWLRLAVVAVPLLGLLGATLALRLIGDLKEERAQLLLKLDTLRQAQTQVAAAPRTTAPRRSDAPQDRSPTPAAPRMPPPATPALQSAAPAPALGTDQSDLGFGSTPDDGRAPIAIDEFIRALNFPDDPADQEGIRCLRLALADREAARLIRAAQDVLTLLSQDGIYMDDLTPDRAKPEIWRRFAQGERGKTVAALGGIRDRSSIALTMGRMRSDTIFRDAAHHFLRQFDRSFQAFEKHADDRDLIELSDTRTARAFMLMGRVTGVFD